MRSPPEARAAVAFSRVRGGVVALPMLRASHQPPVQNTIDLHRRIEAISPRPTSMGKTVGPDFAYEFLGSAEASPGSTSWVLRARSRNESWPRDAGAWRDGAGLGGTSTGHEPGPGGSGTLSRSPASSPDFGRPSAAAPSAGAPQTGRPAVRSSSVAPTASPAPVAAVPGVPGSMNRWAYARVRLAR